MKLLFFSSIYNIILSSAKSCLVVIASLEKVWFISKIGPIWLNLFLCLYLIAEIRERQNEKSSLGIKKFRKI